ncbi:MAG TPA: Asp-tRNA(Asn)/Glu-tRNA(Gln) amidotransferase subunit GatC [Patescibacteria group bacterium]|nr:Asp-tRNA(Asn)/Glu-tRNA(Gln) amidotransferase subunit GatC [Patescibacteria group bacterium]
MAKFTKSDVLHVAKLANLNLTDAELKKFLPQLSTIVEHISELNKVDTNNIEPTNQTTGLTNIFREDQVKVSSINQASALAGTDNIHNGYFKVPAILEGRTYK